MKPDCLSWSSSQLSFFVVKHLKILSFTYFETLKMMNFSYSYEAPQKFIACLVSSFSCIPFYNFHV